MPSIDPIWKSMDAIGDGSDPMSPVDSIGDGSDSMRPIDAVDQCVRGMEVDRRSIVAIDRSDMENRSGMEVDGCVRRWK